ncbi:long-chain fatty acid transporter, partial [Acinetobacter baumannii]|nr:long-chain fatty acid transporter [Acinetobacter baumannii]
PGSDSVLSATAIDGIVTKKATEALQAQGLPVNDQTLALAKGQVLASPQFKQLAGALAAANNYLGNGGTKVKVDTQNLSFVFGYQPTKNFNFYAGPVLQTVKGNVSLRGQAYSL